MHARMTLIGMETELNNQAVPKSIADTWTLENEGFDKDTLLACIVQTGGQFEPLYTNPEYFHMMSGYWWKKWTRTFTKWFDAFDLEYQPLWNKDGFKEITEETHDTGSESTEHGTETVVDGATSYSKQGQDTEVVDDDTTSTSTTNVVDQLSGKDITDHDYKGTKDNENEVSAFDSSNYSPHDQSHEVIESLKDETTLEYGKKDVTDTTVTGSGTDDKTTTKNWSESGSGSNDETTTVEGSSSTDKSNDREYTHTSHEWGNIGVTTSQSMLAEELRIQSWSIYQHMADLFCKELLIQVY